MEAASACGQWVNDDVGTNALFSLGALTHMRRLDTGDADNDAGVSILVNKSHLAKHYIVIFSINMEASGF